MSSASNAMFQNIGNTGSTGLGSMLPTSFNTDSSSRTVWIIVGLLILAIISYAVYYYYVKQEDHLFRTANRGFWDSLLKWESKYPMPSVGIPNPAEVKREETEMTEVVQELKQELKYEAKELNRERKQGEPQVEKVHHKRETWCFVGEDLTGRFCVKVPSEQSCDRDRTYGSRSDCEMTQASHMPAGILTNGGAGMLPLSGNRF